MHLKITLEKLETLDACLDGRQMFRKLFGDAIEVEWTLEKQIETLKGPLGKYVFWAVSRKLIPLWSMGDGTDLSRANLYGADLSRANLYGADLSRANLYGANLYGADLSRANLYGANLYGANLYGANLYGADLSGADLSEAVLSGANLSEVDLSRANLYGARISQSQAEFFKKLEWSRTEEGTLTRIPKE
jgi:uncharacterized protein YjbI with pentapeptide repeats